MTDNISKRCTFNRPIYVKTLTAFFACIRTKIRKAKENNNNNQSKTINDLKEKIISLTKENEKLKEKNSYLKSELTKLRHSDPQIEGLSQNESVQETPRKLSNESHKDKDKDRSYKNHSNTRKIKTRILIARKMNYKRIRIERNIKLRRKVTSTSLIMKKVRKM